MTMTWQQAFEQFKEDCELAYGNNGTKKTYLCAIKRFCAAFVSSVATPNLVTSEQIKDYLLTFDSPSTRKNNLYAVKFFYRTTVVVNGVVESVPIPTNERRLPKVINKEYLIKCINQVPKLIDRTILSIGFSTGLRVSEVCKLQVSNIHFDSKYIMIVNGKGRKDRIVPLSEKMEALLLEYIDEHNPSNMLFDGVNARYCNALIKEYIGDQFTFHSLRHSCFTALLESGTDLRTIQKIAGHNSISTTEIYTHVSVDRIKTINLPI